MNLAKRCILVDTRINNIYQFGGYGSRNAATIYDYKIKWTRPPRVPPFDVRQTGDLGLQVDVKPTDTLLYYENSKELEEKPGMVSRKDSLRFLTQQRCDDIINGKLNAYKAELQEQQKVFYREKAEKLEYILEEELEYGLEPTVTKEEIEAARNKAKDLSKL